MNAKTNDLNEITMGVLKNNCFQRQQKLKNLN